MTPPPAASKQAAVTMVHWTGAAPAVVADSNRLGNEEHHWPVSRILITTTGQ